jgi:antibiotic biosynthesis monooxygenase (ABM) superfamily enzyme
MDQLPVTVVVSRRPAPGRERELEEWARGLVDLASRFPGHLTGEVMHAGDSEGDLVVAISWANADAVHFWERSEERDAWLSRADELLLEPARPQSLSGFESIFASSSSAVPVPRWKTAVVIALAIYPASLVVNVVLGPVLADWALPLRVLATTAILVPFMTWAGVPWISRRLDGWLHRAPTPG